MKISTLAILSMSLLIFTAMLFGCRGGQENERIQLFIQSADIGDCKLKGSMSYDSLKGIYTLKGAGANMWGGLDAFHFAWLEKDGDFVLRANIMFEGDGVNTHRKIGIQVRETLDADSRYADIAVHGDGLTSLQYRMVKGGVTEELVSANRAPSQIEFERKGNLFRMKTGTSLTPQIADNEIEIQLPAKCYIGIFICSHEENILETAYFSNVVLE